MAFVKIFALISTLLLNNLANSTECRSCYNINEGTCFDSKINLNNSLEYSTCSVHSKNLDLEMRRVYGTNFEHKTQSIFDVRCVYYEKFYRLTNQSEVYRGCLQKKYARNFCENQKKNQDYYLYNLIKCDVCTNDFCNSNSGLNPRLNRFFPIILLLIIHFK